MRAFGEESGAVWVRRGAGASSAPRSRSCSATAWSPARRACGGGCWCLGPAPEYCLLAGEPVGRAAAATVCLPAGWSATVCEREVALEWLSRPWIG